MGSNHWPRAYESRALTNWATPPFEEIYNSLIIWLQANDDDVNPIHVEDVMKLSGGGDWHTAYVLLYGPRKLPVDFKKVTEEEGKKSEEKMET